MRLDASGGRPTGFDYERLTLACLVVAWHSVVTSYGGDVQLRLAAGPLGPLVALLMPMFFSLSGFLVAGSLERTRTIGKFLGLRALRIYPALVVEVVLSAFILGPLLTTLPLGTYVADPQFRMYLLNALGDVHFALPGVFSANPLASTVNGQLWTIPFELGCYVTIAALGMLGIVKRRWLFLVAIPLFTLVFAAYLLGKYGQISHPDGAAIPGPLLVIAFLIGVALYCYRDRVPHRWPVFAVSAVVGLTLLAIPYGDFLAPLPIAYSTVFLGLLNPPKLRMLRGADYSYGIFLYGFVIQQTFASFGSWTHHWFVNIAVCLPAAALVAAASWHWVESPAAGLKIHLSGAETWWLRRPTKPAVVISE